MILNMFVCFVCDLLCLFVTLHELLLFVVHCAMLCDSLFCVICACVWLLECVLVLSVFVCSLWFIVWWCMYRRCVCCACVVVCRNVFV